MADNVLLAVVGLSPQVITETLYALANEGKRMDAIYLITTRPGKDEILKGLLAPGDGRLRRFCDDYMSGKMPDCGPHTLHVVRDAAGIELDDITSVDDNEALLQICLQLTFNLTSSTERTVFFLVAGGRKTMTSCLTLAAQLYGRPQDRLLHVLVSPEFESCREFWYPAKKEEMVRLFDEKKQPFYKDSRYAAVELINIPFVSVRDGLSPNLLDRPRSPADLMSSLIRETPSTLNVNLTAGKITYKGMEMDMKPAHLALYAFFADRKKNCDRERPCRGCDLCFIDSNSIINGTGVAEMYRRIPGGRFTAEMSDTGISSLSKENFNSYRSKIFKGISRVFGRATAEEIAITAVGSRPDTRYGIRLERNLMRLEW